MEIKINHYFTDAELIWLRQTIGPGDTVTREHSAPKVGWGKHVWELELGKLYNILRFKNESDAVVYMLRWS